MTSPSLLESLARVITPPSLPSFLALNSPHSPTSLTFNHRDYEKKGSLKPNCQSDIAPRRQAFKTSIFSSGVVPGHQPTSIPNRITCRCQLQAPMAEGLPEEANAIGDSRKTTETETHSPQATVYACSFPGGRLPAKFGIQPIKLELYLLLHACTAKYVRVHLRHSGYIKRVE